MSFVLQGLLLGQTQGSIAKAVGLHRSQICRFARRDEVRELIKTVQTQIVMENLSKVTEWFADLIQNEQKDPLKRWMQFKARQQVIELSFTLFS